ncbi:RNA methyltransferase [Gracilinema caldarium]|uniref:RNA methyltransferase n=1 Tax=Gracilinema caldarium TaxID=215591 RepID=UPI0026ECEF67|nr:RNA methyltransferase [Gracilinema caldarium]
MQLLDIVVVLSRPAESGNVGAVCRAMKNMGLSHLRIVSPEAPLVDEQIRARAVHATDVWDGAELYSTLKDAIADCAFVIGTTGRRGKKRKHVSMTPEEVAEFCYTHPGPAAIVFGNERTGLDSDEIAICNLASHIPVDEAFPSLNLSHAVQVYTYVIHRYFTSCELKDTQGTWKPVSQNEIESLVKTVTDSLASIGFYKQAGRDLQERFFRDLFARSGITKEEQEYLAGIFRKIGKLAN